MNAEVFALVLLSAAMHAGWNFAVRRVAGHMGVVWLGMWVGVIVFLPGAVGVVLWGDLYASMTWAGIACMVATGLIHAIYFILLTRVYEQGEISVAYPIARGSGIGLTAVCAWLLLGEAISPAGGIGIAGVFCGIATLGLPAYRQVGGTRSVKLALGVGATIVIYSLVDKVGVHIVHPLFYIWFMYLSAAVSLWPWMARRYPGELRQIARHYRAYVLAIGLGSSATYLLVLFAYTLGPVSYIVAVREFAVVVGAALGVVFLKERLTLSKGLGIALIVAGLVCVKIG